MSSHRNVNKLVILKKFSDFPRHIEDISKADVESNNKGVLTLFTDGKLILTTWLNKKVSSKVVEDVSDAVWQRGGESEVIIICHSGMLLRYSLHFDTGLSCSLQLSAPSLLSLIREKDSSIRSLRSPKTLGYNADHILLQLQSDRLAILATNGGGRPTMVGVIRTPPVRTAHLGQGGVLVQPVTGNDLYQYSIMTCKMTEVINLSLQRTNSDLIEWGSLINSSTGETISLVDSDRHLYVTHFKNRKLVNNKGGVCRKRLELRQIIWPSNFQPSRIAQISLALSDTLLSVFCMIKDENAEVHHYLAFDVNTKYLNSHHIFTEITVIVPGLHHNIPDLFITSEGVAALMDEDVSVSSIDSEVDLGEMLTALEESLKEQNIAKVTEVKAMVEQGLSVFLSSCNHQEGWVGLAEMRAQQYGKLADLILSYITDYAQNADSYSLALAIKNMAEHHFMNIQEEMANVLHYVDNESISQMVLQMKEQVSFYLRSVEQLQLPEEGADNKGLAEQYLAWGDKPVKVILKDALNKKCVEAAESYLQLKPWIYGTVTTDEIITACIDMAREKTPNESHNILVNMDECYNEKLKRILYSSDDLFVLEVLGDAMRKRGNFSHVESMAVELVAIIHKTHSDFLTLPPQVWTELVHHGDASAENVIGPITVGQVAQWTPLAMMLVMTDLYVCTSDPTILEHVDTDVRWQYLLYQCDVKNLKRWVIKEFGDNDMTLLEKEFTSWQYAEQIWTDPIYRSYRNKVSESLPESKKSDKGRELAASSEPKNIGFNMLMGPQYGSDLESSPTSQDKVSLHSVSISACEGDTWSVQSFDVSDRSDITWSEDLFRPITQSMVDLVVIAGVPFAEMMLNFLANFGVFTTSEKKSAQKLMRRLLISGALEKLPFMNANHQCQVSQDEVHKIVLGYLGNNNLLLPAYDYIKKFSLQENITMNPESFGIPSWTKVISAFMKLGEDKSKEVIYDLSLKNLSLLSDSCQKSSDLEFPAFLTMLFAPSKSLGDFLEYGEKGVDSENGEIAALCHILSKFSLTPRQVAMNLSRKYPYLKKILSRSENTISADVTMYDLLNDNIPYDLSRLFTWQPENRHGYDSAAAMPTFSDKELMKNYGLLHSLDFMYYLRDARPSYACAALITSLGINDKKMDEVKSKVYGLALSCWPDRGVCAACVALLYMSNLDAEPLRVVLSSAFLVLQTRNERCAKMKLDKRQAQEHLAIAEIRDVLEQLCNGETRSNAAAVLLGMLENGIISSANAKARALLKDKIDTTQETNDSIDPEVLHSQVMSQDHALLYIEGMRLCVELSKIYELPWPVKLLHNLAECNQWFMFIILAQVFKCPRVQSLKSAESFQSMALKEHMTFALSHIHYYRDGVLQQQGSRTPNRDLRSSLYSRIGIRGRVDSASPPHSSGDEKQKSSSSPSEYDFSTIDDALSITTTETCFDVGLDAWLSCGLSDFYSILLACHQKENPEVELATAAVALEAPVLSVLAACYNKEQSVTHFAVWLYTQLRQESKKLLHPVMIKSENYQFLVSDSTRVNRAVKRSECCRACDMYVLQSGLNEVKHFLLRHISEGSIDVPIEGLRIFYPKSPLLPLLEALHEVNTKCRQESITEQLTLCAMTMAEVSQEKSDPFSKNRDWFALFVVDVIGSALDDYITNSHLQFQLLYVLKAVSQQQPFCHCGINWNLTSDICEAFGAVRFKVRFKDLFSSFEGGDIGSFAEKIVSSLTCRKYFTEALKVSQLVNLPIYEILCAQIQADFEKDRKTILENMSAFEEFLKRSHLRLCQEEVPSKYSVSCFVCLSKDLERYDFKYLCLQYAVIWMYQTQHSSSSSAETTPVQHVSKFLGTCGDDSRDLESEMWLTYIKALPGCPELPVSPLKHLGHWPWEGQDGRSPLNRTIILKAAGMKETSVARSISEQTENDIDCMSPQSPLSSDSEVVFMSCDGSHLSSPIKLDININKEKLALLKESMLQDETCIKSVDMVVGLCLDRGMVITACRILKFFNRTYKDVDTVLQILALADGSENDKPDDESTCSGESFKTSSQTAARKKRTRNRNISFGSSLSVLSLDPDDDLGMKTPTLIRKSVGLRHGRKTAERIILLYRVAASLDLSYNYVIHHPTPITLLSLVLRLKGGGTIQLARDLINALPIPQSAIVNFLCEEAVATITAGPGTPGILQADRLLPWDELEKQWRDLITLCEDPSTLGNQLLDVGQRLGSSYPDQLAKVHSMSVELVIRAHDCFTAASNMEGISTVLRTSFYLTTSLLQHFQYSLMVRLLTGVGRYGEMSYIIDALREHDQFEPLLGPGSESKECSRGLDRALVHYLRSKYPNDKDTLILVALHFLLYSEVAGMWAADAEKLVDQVLEATVDLGVSCSSIVTSPSSKSQQKEAPSRATSRKQTSKGNDRQSSSVADDMPPVYLHNADNKLLTQAMHSYAHAAQYYMQDQQITAAVTCSRSAELVALQIAHVQNSTNDTALRLLKLPSSGVRIVTTKHLNVCEAILVGRAYDTNVDWSTALYHQFVVDGNELYLAEYLENFSLTAEVLLDVVKKLEHGGVTRVRQERIAKLLAYIEEADVVYRVASQLGLKNNIEACLSSSSAPYLKDTVFKKGLTFSS
ncbi:LOW QUALITY PROTEIN: spatacsin [Macrobrachium rosenbergii]|uniref:LOW QUALITY PROTEIN: spatacsin n=1 Tax=Macrobrachium rosenbergii TaxID=79674 RepID=UPI0034D6C654